MPMAVLCVATAVWMACMGREWFIPLWGNLLLFKNVCSRTGEFYGRADVVCVYYHSVLSWLGLLLLSYLTLGGVKLALIISLLWSTNRRPVRICRGTGLEQFLPAIFMGVLLRDEDGRNIS